MKRRYKLDMVVILEPRISGTHASRVIRNWGFGHSCRVEAEGFSGGIWLLWELDGLTVDVLERDEQYVHCKLDLGGDEMMFTIAYVNPNKQRRSWIWSLLQQKANGIEEPWLITRDFNEIKSPLEQKGGGRINETRCRRFNAWIQECNLIDIEANGPFFTWKCPKSDGLDRVYRRLDKCLCNEQWRERFVAVDVCVIPRVCSDHYPLLVRLNGVERGFKERNFRFEAMWQMHDQFGEVMNSARKSIDCRSNPFLVNLEKEIEEEIMRTLRQEEILWYQKSRGRWIEEGDKNTRYHHNKTLVRRRRNKITMLRNDAGEWVDNEEEIVNMFQEYYESLFRMEGESGGWLKTDQG
ncbi:hypothetical protein K1719_030658 [Acacia pycnantha]|nr:hypothetical protein K1719_030658 [Acacia pycnantha]